MASAAVASMTTTALPAANSADEIRPDAAANNPSVDEVRKSDSEASQSGGKSGETESDERQQPESGNKVEIVGGKVLRVTDDGLVIREVPEVDGFYDEVEIEDMEFDEETLTYFYPCPCGDRFRISEDDLRDGEVVATCPSCSLTIKVVYDPEDFASDTETSTSDSDSD